MHSGRHGGSFDHLLEKHDEDNEGEDRGLSLGMTGTTSLDSFSLGDFEPQHSAPRSRTYPHPAHNQSHSTASSKLRADDSRGQQRQRGRHILQPSPPPRYVDSQTSREVHSGLGSYPRPAQRDVMSQDTLGERDFDYRYRYDTSNTSAPPMLSLQDSASRSSRSAGTGVATDRDLRRNHQEFDVMPIHEAFSHGAMMMSDTAGSAHPLSPSTQNPSLEESSSRGNVVECQPLPAALYESHHSQSPTDNNWEDSGSSGQHQPPQSPLLTSVQPSYYPVFFSPESGRLFMNMDGSYKPLPDLHRHFTDAPSTQPGPTFDQVYL